MALSRKYSLTMVRASLSLAEIAHALRITESDAVEKFKDARVTSWFAEIWGETLFSYRRHSSSNHPGSDAAFALGPIGRFDISVRCFNKGRIKFQKSKFIGSGRQATSDDLIDSVEDVERMVIVDLREFPLLSFYPIDTKILLREIHADNLTATGMTPTKFDAWIKERFSVDIRVISLPVLDGPTL